MTDKEMRDANKKAEFIRDAMPNGWLQNGRELKEAAEILWLNSGDSLLLEATTENPPKFFKVSGLSRTYVLLSSFSIENLLKGLIICNNPLFINKGVLTQELKTHNLLELSRRINGFRLSEKERRFCITAQDALPYWGRYPVPLKFQELKQELEADSDYRDAFLQLYERLCKLIDDETIDGWDSEGGAEILPTRNFKFSDIII